MKLARMFDSTLRNILGPNDMPTDARVVDLIVGLYGTH